MRTSILFLLVVFISSIFSFIDYWNYYCMKIFCSRVLLCNKVRKMFKFMTDCKHCMKCVKIVLLFCFALLMVSPVSEVSQWGLRWQGWGVVEQTWRENSWALLMIEQGIFLFFFDEFNCFLVMFLTAGKQHLFLLQMEMEWRLANLTGKT